MDSPSRPPRQKLLAPMLAMLLMAISLGLAPNSLSPLGIHFRDAGSASQSNGSNPVAQAPSGGSDVSSPPPAILLMKSSSNRPPVTIVRWSELQPRLANGGLVLIDARPAESYRLHHIPGAISIPPETAEEEFLKLIAPYPKNQPIVVYCASISCHVARALAQHLASLGYTQVEDFEGGMAEYLQAQRDAIK